jgi:hypothetical protein
LPAPDQRHRRRHAADGHVDMSAHRILNQRARALVGNVKEPGLGHARQELGGQMLRAAAADRAVADRIGLGTGSLDQFLQRLVRGRGRDEHQRKGRDQGHRLEIGARIVSHVLEQAGVDGHLARRAEEDRVAVRRTLGDARRPDHAGGPRLVLDDDGLAQELRQLLRHCPSGDVRSSARRVGNDQLDRLCGIRARLRRCRGGRTREGQKECCATKRLASRQGSVETVAYHPDVMRTASDASITASYFSFIVRSSHRRTM